MKNENPFKDKLYQHTLPVREEVWQAIEKSLPDKENRRLPVFWLILFASALIGGSLMLGYMKRDTAPQDQVPQDSARTITVQPDLSVAAPTALQPEPGEKATAHIASGEATIEAVATTNKPMQTIAEGNSLNLNNHAGSSHSTRNTYAENNQALSKNNSSTKPVLSNLTATPSSSNNQAALHQQATSTQTNANIKQTPAVHTPATTNSNSNNTATNSTQVIIAEDNAGALVTPVAKRNTRITGVLPGLNDEVASDEAILAELSTIRPDPSCYKFSAKGGQYFFSTDFFSGPGWSPRTFSDPDGNASVYSLARKTTESSLYAWSAGARFNMHLHNGFAIRLGILYDQAGDIFDYTDTLATRSTTRIDSFFNADGSFLHADTTRILIFGTLIKRINNTYRHLDVPILLSYEFPVGRASFMINGGPVFNLTSSHKGQILDPMLIPRSITPGQSNQLSAYKTSLGLSVYLGAGIVFPLTNHFAGIVEPRYLYRIKPVTIKSYPLEEHRHYAGLNIGLRYFFK